MKILFRAFLPLVTLALPAFGQENLRSRLAPITAPVRYAGVYHLGTGAWTRPSTGGAPPPTSGSSTAILFDNTCATGYFAGLPVGAHCADEGRLPSPTSPVQTNAWGLGHDSEIGTQASYEIDGFQIGYCTTSTTPAGYTIGFYERYVACDPIGTPTASFALTGLPGATLAGSSTCWVVDLDLCASSQSFTMLADSDQVYNGSTSGQTDNFGWSWEMTSTAPGLADGYMMAGGVISAGSFQTCSGSDGTVFDQGGVSATYPANSDAIALGCGTLAAGASPEEGSGMGTLDRFRIENASPIADGCYWFGGNPVGNFHMQLYSASVTLPNSAPSSSFCEPALGALTCPCANPASGPNRGCDNSAATGGASLDASGSATLAADTLVFATAGEPLGVTTMLVQGTSGIAAVQRGQGLRCVGGTLKNLYVRSAAGGGISFPGPGDPSISARSAALGDVLGAGTPRYYFAMYRAPVVIGGCSAVSTFNCTNAGAVVWN